MSEPSLERIYLDTVEKTAIGGYDTLALHLERYHYAGKHLNPGPIADIACGSGYGSYLIATEYSAKIDSVTGLDISKDAIAYANQHFKHPLIHFIQADANQFTPGSLFSTIISLETIEHLVAPDTFVRKLSSMLIPGGRIIASAPVTPSMDANPYHLTDFSVSSFKNLFIKNGFSEQASFIQLQKYNPVSLFKKDQPRSKDIRKGLAGYYLHNPGKFFLRMRSLIADGFCNKYMVAVFKKN